MLKSTILVCAFVALMSCTAQAQAVSALTLEPPPLRESEIMAVELTLDIPRDQIVIVTVAGQDEPIANITPFGLGGVSTHTILVSPNAIQDGSLRLVLQDRMRGEDGESAPQARHARVISSSVSALPADRAQ